ncbi:hypothetical protein L6452_20120 [Arctium lappa]|uniref:Uncharacterized protein n=1 Tax=Arctium lappa TaxID=4217 RepID=A0ACB9BAI2_ARCLA|nr:hypothetical protein L6452_20120 [Arctium lappa]
MAKIKKTTARNPNSEGIRQSPRTRVVEQSPNSSNPRPSAILGDNSSPPLTRPFLPIFTPQTRFPNASDIEGSPMTERKEISDRAPTTGEIPESNPFAVILHPNFIPIADSQVSSPAQKSMVDGLITSCSEDESGMPISSTKVNVDHFRKFEFDCSFGTLNSTDKMVTTNPMTRPTVEEIEVTVESLDPFEGFTVGKNVENPVDDIGLGRHEDPFMDFPQNDVVWTEEEEPVVIKPTKKRKRLGKVYARKTNREGTRKSERNKRVMTEGEPSGTKSTDTNCYAASSLQHEQSVREKKRSDEPAIPLQHRPTSPHNGFSSKAAAKMWPKFQTKIGFPEKGIDEHSMREFHFIRQVVDTQGLSKLCHVYDSYNLTLIREFYCEMSVTSASKIQVRGTTVHLTAKRINQFLELNPPKKTEYYALVHKATASDLAEVVAVLGKPKTNWESHTNLMLRTFRASNLTADSNVWIYFVRHTISPTSHDTFITVERMLLLYCLVTGKNINFGRIIMRSIRECSTRSKSRGKFYFPGMLTKLLTEMGVPRYIDDLVVKEQRERFQMDMKAVQRLRDRKEKGVGANEMVGMMQEVLAQNSNLMDTILQQRTEFIERLEDLKVEVQLMVDSRMRRGQEEEHAEVKKLRKMVKRQKKEIAYLKVKLTAEESAHIGAAASSLIAVSLAAPVGHKQPTQPE